MYIYKKNIKTALLLMLPVIILSIIQLCGFVWYEGFSYKTTNKTQESIILTYTSFIFGCFMIVFFGLNKSVNKDISIPYIYKFNLIIIFVLILIFIIPVIVKIYIISGDYNLSTLRNEFYYNENIRSYLFGSGIAAVIVSFYLNPFIWFMVFVLASSQDRLNAIAFYSLITVLVVYSVSIGGRFAIYLSMIAIYFRVVTVVKKFKFKYILWMLLLFILSIAIIKERDVEHVVYSLIEYHLLPPFLLDQKLNDNFYSYFNTNIAFYSLLSSMFVPVIYLFKSVDSVPFIQIGKYFNEFSLPSVITDNLYNGYHTFFVFFYHDFKYSAPIAILIFMIAILVQLVLIPIYSWKIKYLSFVSFSLFSGLFQAGIFSPLNIFIVFTFPLITILLYLLSKRKLIDK